MTLSDGRSAAPAWRGRVCVLRRKVRSLLHRIGSRLIDTTRYRVVPRSVFAETLDSLLREEGFFFIQVGAHDGVRFDDLYTKVTAVNARGIVVEPIRRYYDRLRMNYEDYPGVLALNVALHPHAERVEMFHIDHAKTGGLQSWAAGIGSVLEGHHARAGVPDECMTRTTVEAMSFAGMVEKCGVKRVDLLQIDVEGFDYEILAMVPFEKIRPRLIKYEWVNLDPETRLRAESLLDRHGYRQHREGEDAIAVLGDDGLTASGDGRIAGRHQA
jgi:FkbM family methyltransferase